MKLYKLEADQTLNISLEKAWDFFSNPANLKEITPDYMSFDILTDFGSEFKMHSGMIIEYQVKPLFNIPLHWVTEIKNVEDKVMFVDEQRFGPYAFWHHTHKFYRISENQVRMTDTVYYGLPLGILGQIANFIFVGKQLKGIFDYRYQLLEKRYNNK